MKTLVLTVASAFPPRAGGDLRNAAHIRAAAGLGPVLAVSLAASRGDPGGTNVRQEQLSHRSEGDCWTPPRGGTPGTASITGEDRARLRALVADFAPDTVLVEGVMLAGLTEAARSGGATLILDMHNIESDLHAQVAARRRRRWPFRWRMPDVDGERHAIEAVEREAALAAGMVWVCSREDAAKLERIAPGARIETVPNALPRPADTGPRIRVPDPRTPKLAYVGLLHYGPNVRAAEALAREVMPALVRECPGAALTIAGHAPSRRVRKLHRPPHVTVVADPDDVGPLLASADFSVMPLTEGGGTRIKALEAMAAGLVVIATPLAVEGLGLEDGRDAVIRGTADGMAAEAARLARAPDAFLALANRGRQTALALGDPVRRDERVRRLLRESVSAPAVA